MDILEKIRLSVDDSIEKAINVLQVGGLRVAVVLDSHGKLLGTVTDGDIRRALLRKVRMDARVSYVMNKQPITATIKDDTRQILRLMKKRDVLHIAIVDDDGILLKIETIQNIMGSNKKRNNPVFLMAGGFGVRLHPLTKDIPKPLVKIGDRPILETIILQFIDHGFHDFYISTHYRAEMITEYFGDGRRFGITINYIYEDDPLGTAGALGLLPEMKTNLPIIIMNSDVLTKINFDQLLRFHKEENGIATMCVREYDITVPYGVVEIDDHSIIDITEKPIHKFFVNAGIYVLNNEALLDVRRNIKIDMTDLLINYINNGKTISSFPVHEYWLDIGRMEELSQAQKDIEVHF